MSRIRTIKPEFWQSPKVTSVCRDARLCFLGLLNEADDEGRMRYSAKRLAGVLFGDDDDVTPVKLDAWVAELEGVGLVMHYEVGSARFLLIIGFTEHQRINRPSESALPAPSVNPHGTLTEDARGERNREGNREQGTGITPSSSDDDLTTVFEAWLASTGRNGRTQLSPKRRRKIRDALKVYPLGDVLDAVRGWRNSPHHCGQNATGTTYNELELLLRDCEHIEKFRDLERGGGRAPPVPKAWGVLKELP